MKFIITLIAYWDAFLIWKKNHDWDQYRIKFKRKFDIFPKIKFLKNTSGYLGEYLFRIKIREGFHYELIRVIYWKIEGELQGLTSDYTILKDFDVNGERYLYLKWKVE